MNPSNDPRTRQVNPEISGPKPMPIQVEANPTSPSSNDVPTLPAAMTMPPAKKHNPLIPIIIAVVVALVLIGTLVFVFIRSKSSPKKADQPAVTEEQKPDDGRVSSDDIEKAKKEIDQNLNNINDSTDFQTDDLTDHTLGL